MDFALTDSQELIKKETAALARSFSLDYWLDKDTRAEYPQDFVRAFADRSAGVAASRLSTARAAELSCSFHTGCV